MAKAFDRTLFCFHVEQHRLGAPTSRGYVRGQDLISRGDSYQMAAERVVSQGLTENPAAAGWELDG